MEKALNLYFDGGNAQGIAAWGVIGIGAGKVVCQLSGVCDQSLPQTNNVAEWTALYYAMAYAYGVRNQYDKIIILGDSELVVKQINGEYVVKHPNLIAFYHNVRKIRDAFSESWHLGSPEYTRNMSRIVVRWIPREQNELVDGLGREARARFLGV